MSSARSPEDLYDFSYLQDDDDRELSPNTAALMAPAGNMTPAYVSLTCDGKPRIMDLNNLGLQKGTHLQGHSATGQEGGAVGIKRDFDYPTDHGVWSHHKPRNARVAALQAGSQVPLQAQIWKQEQHQRVEDAVSRLHQAYVSDARGSYLTPDPNPPSQYRQTGGTPDALARPMEPVPPHTPQGWEQDMATRARRATDRIQQEYVDELRQECYYMDQLRQRSKIQEAMDEDKRQRERQKVRQEIFRPVPPDDYQTTAEVQPGPCEVPPLRPPDPCDTPSWPQAGLCDKHANMQAQAPLTEAELDEKRRQLLVKKKSKTNKEPKEGKTKKKNKEGKRGSKKKSNENIVSDAGNQITPQPPMPEANNEIVPDPPSQDAGNQGIPHQPTAPAKNKEIGSGYSKRKRRLLAKSQEIADNGGYAPSIAGMKGHGPSHRYYGPGSTNARAAGADVGTSLIPRQTSQQTMCWNSETAKRGLGFKSKQTREAEQEAKSKSAEAGKLSAETRNKWKKATFC